MNIRTIAVAVFSVVALAACSKPADAPATGDSTVPANATPTVGVPVDSTIKADTMAPKPATDSAKPASDTAKP